MALYLPSISTTTSIEKLHNCDIAGNVPEFLQPLLQRTPQEPAQWLQRVNLHLPDYLVTSVAYIQKPKRFGRLHREFVYVIAESPGGQPDRPPLSIKVERTVEGGVLTGTGWQGNSWNSVTFWGHWPDVNLADDDRLLHALTWAPLQAHGPSLARISRLISLVHHLLPDHPDELLQTACYVFPQTVFEIIHRFYNGHTQPPHEFFMRRSYWFIPRHISLRVVRDTVEGLDTLREHGFLLL